MKRHFYFLLLLPLVFAACNIINPKEATPTYLHVDPFSYSNPDSNITGSSSHDIPSAWIYVNDQPVGTFDLPCTVPVIMSKNSKVLIVPAVTNQGLKSYVFQYPFYQSDTCTLLYNPGKIQSYSPKTRYYTDLTATAFRMKNNFEEGLLFKNLSGDKTMVLEKDPSKVFEGSACGAIYLKAPQTSVECIAQNYFQVDNINNKCYLEIDYKASIPFQIGIQGESATTGNVYGEYLAGFYPKATWSKLYIELSTFILNNQSYNKYYLKFRSSFSDFEGQYSDGYVLIDNIKVISR